MTLKKETILAGEAIEINHDGVGVGINSVNQLAFLAKVDGKDLVFAVTTEEAKGLYLSLGELIQRQQLNPVRLH